MICTATALEELKNRTCYLTPSLFLSSSQFFRSFPYPPGINEDDVKLLAKRYRDPSKEGICNYLNFHNDVEKAKDGMVEKLFEGKPPATYNIPKEVKC